MNYSLNFTIPQGPTGPTGPSLNNLSAYGGKYSNTSQNITLGIATQTQIALANTMPSLNVSNATANSIIVTQAGVYEVNFYLNLSATVSSTITLAVRANGSNIPSTIISRSISPSTNTMYNGSVIVSLNANTTLDMAVSSLVSLGLSLSNGVNATLSVKKLNNL